MKVQIKRIRECAEVLPGLSLKARAEHEPEGTHQIILAKHLTEDVPYVYSDEHELRLTLEKNIDNYLVHAGDILFISRGIRNEAVLVLNVPENTVATSALYIVHAKKGTKSGYLAWILNQPQVQASVQQARTVAGTPLVQRTELMEMTIPVPDMETQTKIAELNELMAKERHIRHQLNEQTKRLHQSIGRQIYNQINKG